MALRYRLASGIGLPRGIRIYRQACLPSAGKPCSRLLKSRLYQHLDGVVCSSFISPEQLFTYTTVAAIPVYTVLIACPHWRQVTAFLKSRVLLFAGSMLYTAAFINCWVSGALRPAGIAFTKVLTTQRVEWFASLLNCKEVTCLAWTHLVLLDLFQARYVYIDGQRHGVPTRHSLVLCFMFGPVGLLSHMVTRTLTSRYNQSRQPQSS